MPPVKHTRIYTPSGLNIRAAGEGEAPSRTIEGYALLFDTDSAPFEDSADRLVVESISPEAVTRELLDTSDIKLNFNHDNSRLLGRSVNGQGTLAYDIDERGVRFSAEMPSTPDGDMILELIRRGDLRGCSFCFSTDYSNADNVEVVKSRDGKREKLTVRHKRMTGIYDFSVVADPAYPDTTVMARALEAASVPEEATEPTDTEAAEAQRATRAAIRRIKQRY